MQWGSSTIAQRDAAVADTLITGRADAAIDGGGARLSAQSWGTVLPIGTSVGVGSDSLTAPLAINLFAKLPQPLGDSVTLNNFTVLRYSR